MDVQMPVMDGYIIKPINVGELADTVMHWVEKGRIP